MEENRLNYSDIHSKTCTTDFTNYYAAKTYIDGICCKTRPVYFGGEEFPPKYIFTDENNELKEDTDKCFDDFFEKLYSVCGYKSFVTMGITHYEKAAIQALLRLRTIHEDIEIEITMEPNRFFPLVPNYEKLVNKL